MAEKEQKHTIIPKHTKLSEKEKQELFKKYDLTIKELPKILDIDPAIAHLDAKEGDVVKIARKSLTAGESMYYRSVTHG